MECVLGATPREFESRILRSGANQPYVSRPATRLPTLRTCLHRTVPLPYTLRSRPAPFVELEQQIRGMELLTRFVARGVRPSLLEVEARLTQLAKTVDDFYALLGERNWVFHDSINVEAVAKIIRDATDAVEAEARFVLIYQDADTLRFMSNMLSRHEPLRRRRHLLDRAREDFVAGDMKRR